MKEKIAILGGGNIGRAIAKGLLASGKYPAENLTVTDLNLSYLDDLKDQGILVTRENVSAVRASDITILCVQPTQVSDLMAEIRDAIDPGKQILAFVVAAYEIKDIRKLAGKPVNIVRVMPNTAIAIRESMTCLATHDGGNGALEKIRAIFDHLGTTMVIREQLMGAATILLLRRHEERPPSCCSQAIIRRTR
jgi:pyrroline-5-carboxylate reductase